MPEIEELEKKWNCKIDFPSTEQASDVVTISGPEYQVPQALDAFLGMVPESHEIALEHCDDLRNFFNSPEFDMELRQKLKERNGHKPVLSAKTADDAVPEVRTRAKDKIIRALRRLK